MKKIISSEVKKKAGVEGSANDEETTPRKTVANEGDGVSTFPETSQNTRKMRSLV